MKKRLLMLMVCLFLLPRALAAAPIEKEDMIFLFDGKAYTVGEEANPLLSALEARYGKGIETQTESCLFTGMDKEFDFGEVLIGTYPIGRAGGDVLESIIVLEGELKTSRGIGIGASLEEVETAYGSDYVLDYNQITFCGGDPLTEPVLVFFLDLKANAVSGFFLMGNVN